LFRAFRGVYPDDISIGKIEVALRNRKTAAHAKRRLRKSMMTVGALVALVLLLAGGYLGYEAAAVRRAGSEWQRVSRLLEEKKFAEAQAGCRKVVAELSKVRLLSRARKVELLALVDGVRNSEMVRQGAAGRVAVDGVYVPGGDLAKVNGVKELQREAASLEEAGRPGEALVKYEQARQLAGELEPELAGRFAGEIEAAMLAASGRQVELLLGQARQLMQARDFAGARGRANEAANLSKQYGLRDSGLAAQIAAIYQSIDRARFDTLVAAGDKYLTAGGYEEALAAYDQALALIRGQKPAADHAEVLERIRVSMAEARVNIQAAKGDRSFQSRSWREAINAYTTAIKLHQEGSLRKELPAYVRAVQNLDQARRQAALAELQLAEREARQYFAAGNWRKAKAAYTRVRSLAGQGGYLADREFAGIRDAAEASLAEVNERLLIGAKRDYLLERHRAILRKVFSLGGEVSFLDPEVVFLLEDEIGMKFSITARTYEKQKDRGKYTFYEAIYAFNRKSGEWSLLDQSTSSRESD
jgi:tetratricopeptide (TPR) repeat protein